MSQLNFFMDAQDDEQFLVMLRSRSDTAIAAGIVFPGDPAELVSAFPPFGPALNFELTNKAVPPRSISPPSTTGVPLDTYKDLHISCTRCLMQGGTLVSGRIYAKIGWLDTPEANRIGKAWYAAIERWIKKRYRRYRDLWWIGPSAEKWSLAGGRLAFGALNAFVESLRDAGEG